MEIISEGMPISKNSDDNTVLLRQNEVAVHH